MAARLRAHLEAINAHFDAASEPCLRKFSLDEETVTFKVAAASASGEVSISLFERSSYPRTGGLAFADGTSELVAAVEAIGPSLSEDASLDKANLDYDFARGAELENSLLRLRHQWEIKDQKRRDAADEKRLAEEKEAEAALSALPASAKPRAKRTVDGKSKGPQKQGAHQIFSSAEATRMLCNELFDMMKEEREGFDGVSADCVECDIHKWRVTVSDITPDCPLHADLARLKAAGIGEASIEFELSFTPDMHPFYPCFLKVVRPRFVGVVAEAVMTHPAMTLQGWDPMKRVKWLLRCAQAFLELHGRVDVDDERNDPARHPEGAYTAAEWAICRLELLAQVTPVWAESETELIASRSAEVDLERIRELNYGKKRKVGEKTEGGKSAPWESGVGYGHSGTEGGAQWDISATEKAQAQVDVEMREMIEQVTDFTRSGLLKAELAAAKPSGRRGKKDKEQSAAGSSSSGVSAPSETELAAAYEAKMRDLSFDACDAIPGHHYHARAEGKEAASSQLAARTKRLTLEAADMMGGGLPVSVSSSIWGRMCEGQMHSWRAMISGPEGTPYSAGLFIFDILCPSDYPNVAPKVNLQTTGGGSVRFNPNLYNCGKVCLSLLGTWQGDQGESWHAKTSTLLQVLMSIQALILVPDPFFNEPGYERNRGTPEGDQQSRSYNEAIREATVRYAMIGQLHKPTPELEEPILEHFRMRKAAILEQVQGWAADKKNSSRHATTMLNLAAELEAAMNKRL